MKSGSFKLPALLFLLSLSGCAAQPEVRQSTAISEAENLHAVITAATEFNEQLPSQDILVVFDMDNTLLGMDSQLGSVPWYDWQAEMAREAGCQPGELQNRFAAQGVLYFLGSMHPVQNDAAAIITELQQNGFPVLVLTARGMDYQLETLRELNRNEMAFESLSHKLSGGLEFMPADAARAVLYRQGVLMVAGQHKGLMLQALYAELGLPLPRAVVMADDSRQNLTDMQETLTDAEIPHRLFRYSKADEWVEQFDPVSAAADWQQLLPAVQAVSASMQNQNLPDDESLTGCNAN